MYKGRLVLTRGSKLVAQFIKELHASPYGGHFGFFRMYKRVKLVLFWEGMKKDIKQFMTECDMCQRVKYEAVSSVGLF